MPTFDLSQYRRDGYHQLPGILSPEDQRSAVDLFDRLDNADEIPASYEAEYDTGDGVRRLRKLRRLIFNDPEVWAPLLIRAGVADVARQVIGDDAALIFHAAFLKPARVGTPVALHQDQALWSNEYPGAFSVWFAFTPVSPANGGLFGCPGSHTKPLVHRDRPEYVWHPSLDVADEGLADPVQFLLEPGDAVMWDRYFAHGSAPNTSEIDRRGMVVVFADASDPRFAPKDCITLAEIAAVGPA